MDDKTCPESLVRTKGSDRIQVNNILAACARDGGFAFGVGNWVADSIPFENYIAMLEAARIFPL